MRRWSNLGGKAVRDSSRKASGFSSVFIILFLCLFFFFRQTAQTSFHCTLKIVSTWKESGWYQLKRLYATREDFRWAEGWDLYESKRWPSKSCYMPGGSRKQANLPALLPPTAQLLPKMMPREQQKHSCSHVPPPPPSKTHTLSLSLFAFVLNSGPRNVLADSSSSLADYLSILWLSIK